MADKIHALLSWCSENDIFIDPRLEIIQDASTGDIAVYNNSDELLDAPTTRESRLSAPPALS